MYLINSIIQFTALICTLTRSTWAAFGVIALIGAVFIYKDKVMIKRAITSFVIFTSIFTVINITSDGSIVGRAGSMIKDSVNVTEDSGSGRVEIWQKTLKLIAHKPIVGQGPDTLHKSLEKYYPEEFEEYIKINNGYIDKAHNEYLEYWASCGLFTLVTYLNLLVIIGWNLFKRRKDYKYKVLLLTFIAYTVQAFFNISVPMVAPIWWIFLGYCIKCYREDSKKEKENEEKIILVDKDEALI
ncbi:MAG: O-antigen ligase family protein [Clostridium sp.]